MFPDQETYKEQRYLGYIHRAQYTACRATGRVQIKCTLVDDARTVSIHHDI